ncbi:nicotinate phosphoribosyltransferase [Clostridium sp. D53t1_180928_C8]|uniref:nicotinate phosphoribosyltransferase n=1 Tax=Clostridium sp. D53t1_180928_C8 TaxID=2787101 RepID=UPI0018ABDB80|nr:nicotinate phosphoribosyltransferase [Clostridium sp. D53t1_180928_C8]
MTKINLEDDRNLSMLVDFYEFTMSNGYFENDLKDKIVYFDIFFRKNPDNAGFAITAGLEQVIEYIKGLSFNERDIEYLRSRKLFNEEFLDYLLNFKFTGDIYAIQEGTPVFPNEPLLTIRAKVIEAQLIETMLLLTINHQSLIATKANRIKRAAEGKEVLELGARRSQGYDAAIYGARAAYIGGIDGTANTIADEIFGIKAVGTMAHSWIQLFGDEYKAFATYAKTYPDNCILLIDTYNVLKSGIINAIKVSKDILEPQGKELKGIRLDSGDLAYLSKEVRKILNINGLEKCKIIASNSLDEYIISDLMTQGACIDVFGVGERLITAKSEPVFGGVYKLVAVEEKGKIFPRIKLSENIEKVTNPGYKTVWRLFDKESNKAIADVLTVGDEIIDDSKEYEIFDPVYTWKRKLLTNYYARKIQVPIFIKGECVYKSPNLEDIRKYSLEQVDSLWDEVKRFTNPQGYYVDLSEKLWKLKNNMIKEFRG